MKHRAPLYIKSEADWVAYLQHRACHRNPQPRIIARASWTDAGCEVTVYVWFRLEWEETSPTPKNEIEKLRAFQEARQIYGWIIRVYDFYAGVRGLCISEEIPGDPEVAFRRANRAYRRVRDVLVWHRITSVRHLRGVAINVWIAAWQDFFHLHWYGLPIPGATWNRIPK